MSRAVFLTFVVVASVARADPLEQRLLAIETPPSRAELVAAGGSARLIELSRAASSTWLRRAAISALAHFPTREVRSELLVLLGDVDPSVRKSALDTLGAAFRDDASVEPALILRLRDTDPVLRRAAVRALVARTSPSSRVALEAARADEADVETRALLTQALAVRRPQ